MADSKDKITHLQNKLASLLKRQNDFFIEINNLQNEINNLRATRQMSVNDEEEIISKRKQSGTNADSKEQHTSPDKRTYEQQTKQKLSKKTFSKIHKPWNAKSDLEKFIGENLINKIGIVITVIGVAIGAKYAIDHELISPLTRIILGYLMGLGLLGFAIKLKKNYESFSAVLLSGAMVVMYLITYFAYSFYHLIPQSFSFLLMVLFTLFTVIAAVNYNRQVIAHIGLVGAYAVPFLLSEGSGKVVILFSYMSIINVGILAIAFKKYWKPLYYSSFGLTWVIYLSWYMSRYQTQEHFGLAFTFLTIFFIIFYLNSLVYKLIQKEQFEKDDLILLLSNSFIYYGIGYSMLNNLDKEVQLLGLFTLYNAILHFIVSVVIYRQKIADRNLFFLVSGLVLVFITIAIPVQLDGNWVTLLWAGEAALLFWIGRTKQVDFYEKLSYPLMILAFISIIHDWILGYGLFFNGSQNITPLLNINFLSSLMFITAFGFINYVNQNKKYNAPLVAKKRFYNLFSLLIPAILLLTLYLAFRLEISHYWNQLYFDSSFEYQLENQQYPRHFWNDDLNRFKIIWIINYSLLFVSGLSFVNIRKYRNPQLGYINLVLIVLALAVFLVQGLYVLSALRESYLLKPLSQYFQRGMFNIGIRYVSFAFVALSLISCHEYIRRDFIKYRFDKAFDFLLHITILWIATSELIHWIVIFGNTQSYKLGISILWGIYSLFLIILGIWKSKKHLRIGAISLFTVTLIKLIFYDIAHLDTIAKTIVFVSLGILLLIISFLYNKYKYIISDEIKD